MNYNGTMNTSFFFVTAAFSSAIHANCFNFLNAIELN